MDCGQQKMKPKFSRRAYQRPPLPVPRYLTKNQRSEELKEFIEQASTLILEVGCGVGLNPLSYSLKHPSDHILAVERTKTKFEKFYRRYLNHGCPKNLFPVHADVEAVLNHFVSDTSLDQIWFFYPNPEPQNPSRRWIRMPVFEFILTKLKPNGKIIFVTNDKRYRQELSEFNQDFWQMKVIDEKEISLMKTPDFTARTHFEKKYLQAGQTVYEICFSPGITVHEV